jgi:antitoxin (DNA-binding transcriptional repressor) of toxin-antitoxin stability system
MKTVRIAALKARLSAHLRAVRRGDIIAVLDRETPIARIVPFEEGSRLRVRAPAPGAAAPGRIRRPAPLQTGLDIVDLLLEERQTRR